MAPPVLGKVHGQENSRSWPAAIGENFSSPVFYDLNGDGVMEVIASDRSGVYVFDSHANLLPGWPRTVGDLDGDGVLDLCAQGSTFGGGSEHGVYFLRLGARGESEDARARVIVLGK